MIADTQLSRFARFRSELRRGYRSQTSVVIALVFKELRLDATRGKLGIAWTILEPIVQITILVGLWAPTGLSNISGIPLFLFMLAGVVPYLVTRQGISVVSMAIRRNDSLLDYPQVKPFDTIVASFIYEMTLLAISVVIFLAAFKWFRGITPAYPDPLMAFYMVGLLLTLSLGLALLLGTYATLYDDLAKGLGLLSRPLMFVSGVFYSMNQLPASARKILAWNPLAQIIDHLRHYMYGMPLFPEASLEYATFSCILIFALGVIVYSANRFRLLQH